MLGSDEVAGGSFESFSESLGDEVRGDPPSAGDGLLSVGAETVLAAVSLACLAVCSSALSTLSTRLLKKAV